MKNKNILITCGGRRVSLLKFFQTELKKIYPEGLVYITDSHPLLSSAAHLADGFFKVPDLSSPNYINELLNICIENKIVLLIPTFDPELLALSQNEELFKKNGITIVISSTDFINKTINKSNTHRFFKSLNIPFPKEYSKKEYKLPIYIKPNLGSNSKDNFVITSENDFLKKHFVNDEYLFLEYLNPNEFKEYTCDLYYSKTHHLKCAVPRKRLEVRAGEVSKALTKKNEILDFIYKNFSFLPGARGCINIQLFKHISTSKIVCIEINPRFGGGFPLSYHAGANYPLWILNEYLLGKEITFYSGWEDNLLMLRYDQEVIARNFTNG